MSAAVARSADPAHTRPEHAGTVTANGTLAVRQLGNHDGARQAAADSEPASPTATSTSTRPVSSSSHATEGDLSPDQDQDGVEDQDGAHAVLQPAMSAAASHLTSPHTPAMEKAAALDKIVRGGILEIPVQEDADDDDAMEDDDDDQAEHRDHATAVGASVPPGPSPSSPVGLDASAPPTSRPTATAAAHDEKLPSSKGPSSSRPALSLGQLPSRSPSSRNDLPSPWTASPKSQSGAFSQRYGRLIPARAVLESAFSPTRNRSRSAGQEALKRRLQKAFPSFTTPSHLLPSLPSSFFSSGDKPGQVTPPPVPRSNELSPPDDPAVAAPPRAQTIGVKPPARRSASIRSTHSAAAAAAAANRPPLLRRVTSDESMLYHSLSRASSLGDDKEFHDVRDMVNMRLQAIRESLPEVPNFNMRDLARRHTPSFISMNSLSSSDLFGTAVDPASRSPGLDREQTAKGRSPTATEGLSSLDVALQELTGDVVIMGGFRGSILRSAEPPHQQCWAPVKLGFNMRKVNLEVGLGDEDEERMEDTIIPSGMLSHIGPIDISRKLMRKLRHSENARAGKLRVWDYGYDWRLSPALLSRKLREFLETLPCNQPGVVGKSRGAMVIAHSLGGMITRHAVNQQPDLFSGVLFAGTPRRCINILGPLRNGDAVLLNEKLLSAKVNFSMRPAFAFLPEDGFCFIDKNTKEEYRIDFFDPQEWVRWRLSPCMQPPLPALNRPAQSSFLPNPLRARAESRPERRAQVGAAGGSGPSDSASSAAAAHGDRILAPQMHQGADTGAVDAPNSPEGPGPSGPEFERNLEYLTRTLAATRKFREELNHRADHQEANAYPPMAVLYSRMTPTVYAAQVNGREGIPCADAYDDLLFRAGDGVVLARESMPPEGYSVVKGGRVHTDRGHITMLGDMPAVGQALRALLRGRRKGIGAGAPEVGAEA